MNDSLFVCMGHSPRHLPGEPYTLLGLFFAEIFLGGVDEVGEISTGVDRGDDIAKVTMQSEVEGLSNYLMLEVAYKSSFPIETLLA
jgi:hypothetical protein